MGFRGWRKATLWISLARSAFVSTSFGPGENAPIPNEYSGQGIVKFYYQKNGVQGGGIFWCRNESGTRRCDLTFELRLDACGIERIFRVTSRDFERSHGFVIRARCTRYFKEEEKLC